MTSALLPVIPTGVRIGTQVQDLTETFSVVDPATEKELVHVSDAGSTEWMRALDLADKAFAEWSAWPSRKRSQVLYEIFHEIEERRDDFARTMTLEMGKPFAEAQGEVSYGNEYFRWFAEESVRVQGRFSPAPGGNGHILTTHTPVGPRTRVGDYAVEFSPSNGYSQDRASSCRGVSDHSETCCRDSPDAAFPRRGDLRGIGTS